LLQAEHSSPLGAGLFSAARQALNFRGYGNRAACRSLGSCLGGLSRNVRGPAAERGPLSSRTNLRRYMPIGLDSFCGCPPMVSAYEDLPPNRHGPAAVRWWT
jgi:hypothetical protein